MDRRNFVKLAGSALVVAGMAALTGCGETSSTTESEKAASTTESSASTEAASTSSDQKAATRTVKVATTGSGEPYSLVDADGKWTGMEADLWAEVESRLGWTVEMSAVGDTSSVFGELTAGRADVAANCYAITEARLETYIACDPIYGDAQVVIVQPDSSYKTLEDLRGCKMGVTSGQAAQNTIEELAPTYDWEVVTYEESNAGFQDCALGRVDAYANTVTNIEKAESAQGLEFRMLDEKLFGNNVSWFLMPEQSELRDELNKVIADMLEDGTLSELTTKWFLEDMTAYISDEWLKADK